jgi:hypothetical protein
MSNILTDLRDVLSFLNLESFVAYFPATDKMPVNYAVIVPDRDDFQGHSDNFPGVDVQRARIHLFSRGSYMDLKYQLIAALFKKRFKITNRIFNSYDPDTALYEYQIDVEKPYGMQVYKDLMAAMP